MIFRQLFDRESCTYTYILGDQATGRAVIIDPVTALVDRDVGILAELGLELVATLETHVHADHITGGGAIRERTGAYYGVAASAGLDCADLHLREGDTVVFGDRHVTVRETPGHTNTCLTYVLDDDSMAFTGDALLIRGCGRTDFQAGHAPTLFRSVRDKIFGLPDPTKLFPGHDYKGRTVTTVGEEKVHNLRLSLDKTLDQFVHIMDNLNLAQPKKIDVAVPGNLQCGCVEQRPWAPVQRAPDGAPVVDLDWVQSHRNEIRLVDVRQPQEYDGPLSHLPEAELVPLEQLPAKAADWRRDAPTVLICRSGTRSNMAAKELEQMGFRQVASMSGGMLAVRAKQTALR